MKRLTIVSILVALWCAALTSSATSTADAAPASRDRRVYVVSESVGLGARTALPQAFGPEWQVTVDGTPALFVEQLESQHVRRRMA
ncbi:MAG: hypothetical protein R2713_24135, partial [Ilumatobacteraceae bacterium]